jgi:hypothetical protein
MIFPKKVPIKTAMQKIKIGKMVDSIWHLFQVKVIIKISIVAKKPF